ncbi:MAG: hypothetical protein RIE32_14615 [Phycisphaerales bacterium]
MQEFKDGTNIRVVVDGQQRLRAIFDFINNGIRISRAHSPDLAGKTFSQLDPEMQSAFLQYEVACDVLYSAPLSELLDIFARINRYTVKLNSQELRNAQYSGFFKTAAFELGYKFVDYWIAARVLSKSQVSRMAEAELASDILATLCTQIQTNKNVDALYKRYEDQEGPVTEKTKLFEKVMDVIQSVYPPDEMHGTCWTRKHMFYSLAVTIAHVFEPIPNLPKSELKPEQLLNYGQVRSVLNSVSSDFDSCNSPADRPNAPERLKGFITASTQATTDTGSRRDRSVHILSSLEATLEPAG